MAKQILTIAIFVLGLTASLAFASTADKVLVHENIAKRLVNKGIAHIKAVGPEQAARDFMDQDGEFIKGSFYLLFYKSDGTCIALGAKPEVAGKNRFDVHDPDGIYQVREMIKTAKAGGGWVKYKYANPVTGEIQKKETWVLPAPDMDAFVGCGIYY